MAAEGLGLPRVGGCPAALLCCTGRQEVPGEQGRSRRSRALGMGQANAEPGLHSAPDP